MVYMNDAGTRLLSKFRSGLNEKLGRHRGRGRARKCVCCVGMNARVFVMYCPA